MEMRNEAVVSKLFINISLQRFWDGIDGNAAVGETAPPGPAVRSASPEKSGKYPIKSTSGFALKGNKTYNKV